MSSDSARGDERPSLSRGQLLLDVVTAFARTTPSPAERDMLIVLLPILIVLSTILFLLILFLALAIIARRRRGIALSDQDGPVDLSRDEFQEGAGGFAGVESRWLENVSEEEAAVYQRAKEYQIQHPPNSMATDITLSQFLSIQEKGVSAWTFEPDFDVLQPSVLVHARTELTFLPDAGTCTTVQSNLPLPKLNEVYYWEVKLFDFPVSTSLSIGLATKPYPPFRLPGISRYSLAYHSSGDKSHNYPFLSTPFGPALKEGDVLGIGYRPRSGTVFFTRNGRKTEDAFTGLSRWNVFPTIGADGPCSVHVNLGQAGFNHIEANVKKWGLAPSVGTLAPPPAYGSERGSILLQAGGGNGEGSVRRESDFTLSSSPGAGSSASISARRASKARRHSARRTQGLPSSHPSASFSLSTTPIEPSPLRPLVRPSGGVSSSFASQSAGHGDLASFQEEEEGDGSEPAAGPSSGRYLSPTDVAFLRDERPKPDRLTISTSLNDDRGDITEDSGWLTESDEDYENSSQRRLAQYRDEEDDSPAPSSPEQTANPPTPHHSDIHLHDLRISEDMTSSRRYSKSRARAPSAVASRKRPTPQPTVAVNTRGVSSTSSGSRQRASSSAANDSDPTPPPSTIRTTTDVAPPAYTIVDPARYPDGIAVEIPEEILANALTDDPPHHRENPQRLNPD